MATFTVMLFIRILLVLPQLLLRLFLFYLYGDCSLHEELPLFFYGWQSNAPTPMLDANPALDAYAVAAPVPVPVPIPNPVPNPPLPDAVLIRLIGGGIVHGTLTFWDLLTEGPEVTAQHCKHYPQYAKLSPEELENEHKMRLLIVGSSLLSLCLLAYYCWNYP